MFSSFAARGCLLMAVALLALGAGCNPLGRNGDSESEQSIQVGRAHVRDGRYADAEVAFLRALQIQPSSATAHLEVGKLYYEHLQDLPGALYHLGRYARLRPKENKDILSLMTNRCLQELATLVPLGAITQQIQLESNRLAQTNQALRAEVARLQREIAQLQTGLSLPPSTVLGASPARAVGSPESVERSGALTRVTPPNAATPSPSPAAPRRHKVRPKETLYSIARAYRVEPADLIRANPGINPDRIQIGQEIILPRP